MNNTDKVDSTANSLGQNTTDNEADTLSQTSSNELKQSPKTIDIDGHRPVDPSSFEVKDTLNIDGTRPIAKSDFKIEDSLEVDGSRPIISNKPD